MKPISIEISNEHEKDALGELLNWVLNEIQGGDEGYQEEFGPYLKTYQKWMNKVNE